MKKLTGAVAVAGTLLFSGAALADHHGGGMHGHQGKDGMMPMFQQFDENKDGKLSREEVRKGTEQMFGEIDTDKDGQISQEEMRAHHKAMHEKMQSKMQERWKTADKDGDGALSRAEVDAAKMPRLSRDFDQLDTNKDGKLSADEMRAAMKKRMPGGMAGQ